MRLDLNIVGKKWSDIRRGVQMFYKEIIDGAMYDSNGVDSNQGVSTDFEFTDSNDATQPNDGDKLIKPNFKRPTEDRNPALKMNPRHVVGALADKVRQLITDKKLDSIWLPDLASDMVLITEYLHHVRERREHYELLDVVVAITAGGMTDLRKKMLTDADLVQSSIPEEPNSLYTVYITPAVNRKSGYGCEWVEWTPPEQSKGE